MSVQGDWLGYWLGDWLGEVEQEPGAMHGTASFSITVTGTVEVSGAAVGGGSIRRGWKLKVGKREFEIDPLDPMSLQRARDAIADEAEEAAQEVPLEAKPVVIAKQAVRAPSVPAQYSQEAARFIAQAREDYQKTIAALLAIRKARQVEEDDEEALLLLL